MTYWPVDSDLGLPKVLSRYSKNLLQNASVAAVDWAAAKRCIACILWDLSTSPARAGVPYGKGFG